MATKELKVKVTAKTKNAQQNFKALTASVKKNALAIGVLATAFGLLINKVAKAGDVFDKMALRTGLSVEFLSGMKLAVEKAGSSLGEFENGMKRLARNLSDANEGLSTSVRAFERLNVQFVDSDGVLRDTEEVFFDVVKAMNALGSETARSATAQELFGRGGQMLLPLIKSGTEAIREQMERAKELGGVWSAFQAKDAADLVDALTEVKIAFGGLLKTAILPLLPQFTNLSTKLAEFAPALKKVFKVVTDVISDFLSLPPIVQEFGILGALLFGKKALIVIALLTKLKNTILGVQALAQGKISFKDFATANPEELKVLLEGAGLLQPGGAGAEKRGKAPPGVSLPMSLEEGVSLSPTKIQEALGKVKQATIDVVMTFQNTLQSAFFNIFSEITRGVLSVTKAMRSIFSALVQALIQEASARASASIIGSIVGAVVRVGSAVASGGATEAAMPIGGIMSAGGGGGGTIVIQALDSQSFEQALSNPHNRLTIANAVRDVARDA